MVTYKFPILELDPSYLYSCSGSLVLGFKLSGQLRALAKGLRLTHSVH